MDTKWNGTNHDPGEDLEYYVASQIQEAIEGAEEAPGVRQVTPKKHPRLRAWTSLAALLVGFSLVVGSLGTAAGRWITGGDLEWWKGDWQETRAFASEVCGYMRDFLTLGAGGELGWYDTVLQNGDTWAASGFSWGNSFAWGATTSAWEWDTSAPASSMEEEEEAPDAAYQWDKNVLYRVVRNSTILYANTEEPISYSGGLPEGYNFLLIFRDGKAQAWKDGEELDLYGSGVYTEESEWYLPGYENFTAGEDVAGVEVCMAVQETPMPYLRGQYATGYVSRSSPMYSLYEELRNARLFYLGAALSLTAGLVLLVIARRFREDRRRAEAAIAARTVCVWTEFRFLAVALCLLYLVFGNTSRGWWVDGIYTICYPLLQNAPDGLAMAVSYGLGLPLSNLPAVLALCLILWLIHNDHRHNPKPRRSLLGSVRRALLARDLRRPVQKRLRRQAMAPMAVMAGAGILGVALVFVATEYWWWGVYSAYITVTAALYFLVLLFCALSARRQLSLARDIGSVCDHIAAIRAGDLSASLTLPEDADLRQAAEDLTNLQSGLQTALEDRTRSERMKVELISNVSHDLKTPLTSILSYAELLRQEPLDGAAADYARIIDEKAQRLKSMVQDVFEVSKAAADQLPVHLERLDFAKLVRQTLADMADPMEKSGLAFRVDLPEGEVPITADGKRMYRVFQNLIQNALQYALPGSRVYVTLTVSGGRAETAVRNTSRQELPEGVDFTARFVRGDQSRTDGGSGLGLSIASSFTEACGGQFRVETVADLFTAAVSFPLAGEEPRSAGNP